jgi:hypothetical protein
MVPVNRSTPLYRTSAFPSGQALADTRQLRAGRFIQGWRPSKTNRRAVRVREGTRRALALLKRLDAEKNGNIS